MMDETNIRPEEAAAETAPKAEAAQEAAAPPLGRGRKLSPMSADSSTARYTST